MRRDLMRAFVKRTKVPRPIKVATLALDNLRRRIPTHQSIISLPEILECIYTHYREHMEDFIGATPRRFWEQVRPDDPKLESVSDVTQIEGWMDTTYPFVLHGDGGVYTRNTQASILTVSVKAILSESFENTIIPLMALPKHIRIEEADVSTSDNVWGACIHLLNACYDGVHPHTDHLGVDWPTNSHQSQLAGQEICQGNVRVVIWGIAGDLGFFGNELKFPKHGSNDPCWFCPASRRGEAPHSITDLARDAS